MIPPPIKEKLNHLIKPKIQIPLPQMGATNSNPSLLRPRFCNTHRVPLRTSKLNHCGSPCWFAASWWALMNAMQLLDSLAPCGVAALVGFC